MISEVLYKLLCQPTFCASFCIALIDLVRYLYVSPADLVKTERILVGNKQRSQIWICKLYYSCTIKYIKCAFTCFIFQSVSLSSYRSEEISLWQDLVINTNILKLDRKYYITMILTILGSSLLGQEMLVYYRAYICLRGIANIYFNRSIRRHEFEVLAISSIQRTNIMVR